MSKDYSVVIPAYDAAATIRQALLSITGQTLPPAAIFVVNDGSHDDTAAIARTVDGPITVIYKENGGPGSATTAGLKQVTTTFVATLDSDDLWLPTKMERQLDFLQHHDDVTAVFCLAKVFADGTDPDPEKSQQVVRLWTRTTMVYRTAAAQAIGELKDFPEKLGELVEWLGRGLALGHRHHLLDEVLAMRRRRPGSLSDKAGDRMKGYLHAVRDAMERRKKSP